MAAKGSRTVGRRYLPLFVAVSLAALFGQFLLAQDSTSPDAIGQITALLQEKEARTSDQQKLDSQLWYALQSSRGQTLSGLSDVYATATDAVQPDLSGLTRVDIRANVSDDLVNQIVALGGSVAFSSQQDQLIHATVPLSALETLAANPDVLHIAATARARTNVGALTTQGYISHTANKVISTLGKDGTGVNVGVLSDSVDALATLIGTGDLPGDTFVVPGQDGVPGSSEGTAMMEIVHDLAPGAKLFFASAFNGIASFANNIRALRFVYGCDIIVDDVTYFNEGVFQDGPIAQAVNDVVADGAMYFSSAGNSGNLTSGTSGTWEGDFNPGGASGAPLPAGYTLHIFSGAQAFDPLTAGTQFVSLKWSDPLGGSANDYDMFVLASNGASIICAATGAQTGSQDPYEECFRNAGFGAGNRIVIAQKPGAASRALHVDTIGGRLSIGTSGATFGHNAGRNTVSTAATYWNSARTGTKPFVGGAANPTEIFSSDGPRRIFYDPAGNPLTANNFLFGTNGGTVLVKPDVAAADGNSAKTPGFLPFFGTSAAAPHAAAVAALIKSVRPGYSNVQILTAMTQTALDIRAAGLDRDSGYGIVMALAAANYALIH